MLRKRKICVVTGSRAEYGLLYWIMREIEQADELELQLVVTGMHLSNEFGLTLDEIEKDGFHVDHKVEMLLSSDTAVGVTKSTGLGMIGFADVFESLRPDVVVLLGDRFELVAAAYSALFAVIPIAHIHGGELTEGAFDDAIRHGITKMAQLHFTSTEQYRRRVIQMGENPSRVFNVGAPGVENIFRLNLHDREEVEQRIGLALGSRSLLVTFHPSTMEQGKCGEHFSNLLNVLGRLEQTNIVFTKANADTEGRLINEMIDDFVSTRSSAVAHTSLGQISYLSLMRLVSGMVGNSSSGIIEAPSFRIGTVNIGDRQKGRVRAESVIDCDMDERSIDAALDELFSQDFQKRLKTVDNPHGAGQVAKKIVGTLGKAPLEEIIKKPFFDIKPQG